MDRHSCQIFRFVLCFERKYDTLRERYGRRLKRGRRDRSDAEMRCGMKNGLSDLPILLSNQKIGTPRGLVASLRTLTKPFALHTHDFFELELITSGTGVHLLNGQRLPLRPGSMYLLTPADVHAVYPEEPLKYYNTMFREDFFSDEYDYETLLACRCTQTQLSEEEFVRHRTLFELLTEESFRTADAYADSYLRNLLQCLMITLLRSNAAEEALGLPSGGAEPQRNAQEYSPGDSAELQHLGRERRFGTVQSVRSAIFYLQRHFREAVTLEETAAYVHLSPNYFCELFRTETGICFSDYVNRLRVRYAHRLLTSGGGSVTEVCYQSGFRSFSTFSRAFRKEFGCAPSKAGKQK